MILRAFSATASSMGLWLGLLCWLCACQKRSDAAYSQGYVEAEYVYVAAPYGGQLDSLSVTRGQEVTLGQRLFALDPEPEAHATLQARELLAKAQAQLEDAQTGLRPSEIAAIEALRQSVQVELDLARQSLERREKALLELKGAFAEEELDQRRSQVASLRSQLLRVSADLETGRLGAREGQVSALAAAVAGAQAAVDQAEWAQDQKQRSAPVAAIVHDTLYQPGEWVSPGSPVVVLLPPGNLKVRFFVPETELASFAPGDSVEVRIDGRPAALQATVSYLSTEAEYSPPVIYSRETRSKLVYRIEATFAPEVGRDLRPGQPVEVSRRPKP
ncbi:MAG: HlyD family efflux transporter periplasmic adaptor subunit [Planctomycetes bacterium]|nr:HlyD family efflux transporter periplasmic adaptor subunit [Planctomycetota bacterium]HPF13830.1 HlyD family efflux transporter periplasmic adaptor subunit [Planctomycetota bacterium]